ncbi:MAG: GldG family protein [bacterium]|nr:GldG family protein [bacterium]
MNSNKRNNFRLTFAIASILLTGIVFLVISVLGNLRGAQVDMTSDRLFTMSPAAARILKDLQVPVQVKLYITPGEMMPNQFKNLERDVTERMRNFEQVSEGMLQFSVHNPQDDEEMQKNLGAKGVSPFQVRSMEKDQIDLKRIWSAITIAYKDKPEEILPQVLPQSLPALEQDIIGPVFRLTRTAKPKVAVFGPKKELDQQMAMMYMQQGMQPPEPQPMFGRITDLLGQGHYEAVNVDLTATSLVPDDADALIVMATTSLNERQVFEINRTLQRGVPVIMGVQAHEYGYSPARSGRGWDISAQPVDTGLEPMLADLGITVSEDHFMDLNMEVIDLPREVMLGGMRMQTSEPVKLPMQIKVPEAQMSQESGLTNRIAQVFFLWGTPVVSDAAVLQNHGLQTTNLIHSSDNAWQTPFSEGQLPGSLFNPQGKTMVGAQPLAVLIEGMFPDTFANKPVPQWPAAPVADGEAPAPVSDDPAPITPSAGQLLVIGSAKMFDDGVIAAPQNALLLLNAVDYMAGSQDLLSIRSKTLTNRVLKPVEAGTKLFWRFVSIFLVPLLLTAFGITRVTMRRKEAAQYRQIMKQKTSATNR